MPAGKRHRFTKKEDRQAAHVAASVKKADPGMSAKEAKSAGYATVVSRGGGKGKRGRSKK